MNYFNGLLENSFKQNLLYIMAVGGAFYISKSTYDFFVNLIKERNENKEIQNLLQKEKLKISQELLKNSKNEICLYLYYKILNTVYKKDLLLFNKKRREIFNLDDIEKYITFSEEYLKDLKLVEENIFKIIYCDLKIDDNAQDGLKSDKIDMNEIKKKYFSELEIEIPKNLDYQKLNEIIMILFDKTKFYLIKLREHLNYKDDYIDDKLQLTAEYMSFDYVFQKFNFERDTIEKALNFHNLTIIEK